MASTKKAKESLELLVGLGMITLLLLGTGIGCPIRFVTGISCPGCGITRAAWAALHFRFEQAFYYHPLFWALPMLAVLYCFREHFPRKGQSLFLCLLIAAYLVVYLLRLTDRSCMIVTADISSGCVVAILNKILSYAA